MADREQPYDPYIPAGGAGGQPGPNGNHRTAALQAVRHSIRIANLQRRSGYRMLQHSQGGAGLGRVERIVLASPLRLRRHAHDVPPPRGCRLLRCCNLCTWRILISAQEIDSTVGIMRDNINKVSERGARLDSLQDKTDNLAVSAQGFRRGANRVRKQMWWKDMKMRMILIVGIVILLVIIIVPSGKCRLTERFMLLTDAQPSTEESTRRPRSESRDTPHINCAQECVSRQRRATPDRVGIMSLANFGAMAWILSCFSLHSAICL
jgi:hypothetical protein